MVFESPPLSLFVDLLLILEGHSLHSEVLEFSIRRKTLEQFIGVFGPPILSLLEIKFKGCLPCFPSSVPPVMDRVLR